MARCSLPARPIAGAVFAYPVRYLSTQLFRLVSFLFERVIPQFFLQLFDPFWRLELKLLGMIEPVLKVSGVFGVPLLDASLGFADRSIEPKRASSASGSKKGCPGASSAETPASGSRKRTWPSHWL